MRGAARRALNVSCILSIFLAGEKDCICRILRKVEPRDCLLIGFLPTVRDEKYLYIVLAIMTPQPWNAPVNNMELVSRVFSIERIVDNAVWIGALTTNLSGLFVKYVMGGSEPAFERLQCVFFGELQQKGDQRHSNWDPVSSLAEVNSAWIVIEGNIKLSDARERMHHAGVRKFFSL